MAEEKTGKASTKAKNKYNAKAYDHLHITVPIGKKAEIADTAKQQGYSSLNEFVTVAIEEKTERGK